MALKSEKAVLTAEGEKARELANAWYQYSQRQKVKIETLKKTVEGWQTAYEGLLQARTPCTSS
jgi:prophage DNA circulation protein